MNRQRNSETIHWSTFMTFILMIMMNNSFLVESRSAIALPLVLMLLLISFIPLLSVWRARTSQTLRRRLATKQLTEFSFIGAGIITVSFFLGMFNSDINQDIYRTIAAGIAVPYCIIVGLFSRYVYRRILIAQGIDASEDQRSKSKLKKEWGFSIVILLIGVIAYLYFVA
ncbi:hypothetical protein [Alkalicoccobacillus porphyridii]|uniref:Uncharacterized protein n=1 Tax=Alkalicoccobacillus porphyridii TaxID=2597270 RepID=A0A553ZVT2_9BACI|nr:hypothetical protein [Alkalicoccobacillus porphyridii]TSB45588.1 hypothetical protein FN960_15575 [Alkalicoccobacillus porphyridii]